MGLLSKLASLLKAPRVGNAAVLLPDAPRMSEEEKREMLGGAADPRYRQMLGPPVPQSPYERLVLMTEMMRLLLAGWNGKVPERALPDPPKDWRL